MVPLAQAGIILKGTDSISQPQQVIDLNRIKLHRSGGSQKQALAFRPQVLGSNLKQSAKFRFGFKSLGRVFSTNIMGFIDQRQVKNFGILQVRLSFRSDQQSAGDDG